MAQVKIYGLKQSLDPIKPQLSAVIHGCIVDALQLPPDKRFHRFLSLEAADFYYPDNRSSRYTILEISLIAGRSDAAKKQLIKLLFECLHQELNLDPIDLEITIIETPRQNWGIRGQTGDELQLNYKIDV